MITLCVHMVSITVYILTFTFTLYLVPHHRFLEPIELGPVLFGMTASVFLLKATTVFHFFLNFNQVFCPYLSSLPAFLASFSHAFPLTLHLLGPTSSENHLCHSWFSSSPLFLAHICNSGISWVLIDPALYPQHCYFGFLAYLGCFTAQYVPTHKHQHTWGHPRCSASPRIVTMSSASRYTPSCYATTSQSLSTPYMFMNVHQTRDPYAHWHF